MGASCPFHLPLEVDPDNFCPRVQWRKRSPWRPRKSFSPSLSQRTCLTTGAEIIVSELTGRVVWINGRRPRRPCRRVGRSCPYWVSGFKHMFRHNCRLMYKRSRAERRYKSDLPFIRRQHLWDIKGNDPPVEALEWLELDPSQAPLILMTHLSDA